MEECLPMNTSMNASAIWDPGYGLTLLGPSPL